MQEGNIGQKIWNSFECKRLSPEQALSLIIEKARRKRIEERGGETMPQPLTSPPLSHFTLSWFLVDASSRGQTLSADASSQLGKKRPDRISSCFTIVDN